MASGKARQGEDKGTELTVISSFISLLGIPSNVKKRANLQILRKKSKSSNIWINVENPDVN